LRQPSVGSQNAQQSSALAARIAAKRSELENLKQLKELSGALATQMVALEEKLATLRDGTEGLARPGCTRNYMPHILTQHWCYSSCVRAVQLGQCAQGH
jgi:hypothetical protein